MPAVSNPNRSPVFRLITIASSGLGSFILGLWGLQFGFGDGVAGLPAEVVGARHCRRFARWPPAALRCPSSPGSTSR